MRPLKMLVLEPHDVHVLRREMEAEALLAGRDLQGRHVGARGCYLRAADASGRSPGHPGHGRALPLTRVAVHTQLRQGGCRLGAGESLMLRQPIALMKLLLHSSQLSLSLSGHCWIEL